MIAIAAGGWFYYQQQQREEFVKVQAARQAQQPVEVSQEEYDAIQADIAKEEARLKRRKNRPTVKGVNNSSFNGAQMGGH